MTDTVKKNKIKYSFFNPCIEHSYWECRDIIKKIIELQYREKFKTSDIPEIIIPATNFHPIDDLRKSFRKYNVKYRESKFAEKFFARVNFDLCKNEVLKRTLRLIGSIIN